MKKILILVISLVVTSSILLAQKTINDANAEKRNVSGYHAIEVSGGIDLFLSQGEESVAVSASETKFRDRIRTEVKNGILKIWFDHGNLNMDWGNRKMKAYVSFKNLDNLEGSCGSDIKVEGKIKVTSLNLDISGGADFDGKVELDDLKVDASGGSDVYITINKELTAEASGGSDVFYKGDGTIREVKSSGSSSIKKTSR